MSKKVSIIISLILITLLSGCIVTDTDDEMKEQLSNRVNELNNSFKEEDNVSKNITVEKYFSSEKLYAFNYIYEYNNEDQSYKISYYDSIFNKKFEFKDGVLTLSNYYVDIEDYLPQDTLNVTEEEFIDYYVLDGLLSFNIDISDSEFTYEWQIFPDWDIQVNTFVLNEDITYELITYDQSIVLNQLTVTFISTHTNIEESYIRDFTIVGYDVDSHCWYKISK